MSTEEQVEALAKVLAEHEGSANGCSCGGWDSPDQFWTYRCLVSHREHVAQALGSLLDEARAEGAEKQHYNDARQFDEYADKHGLCIAGGMRISDCAEGPCDCGWEGLPLQLARARAEGRREALDEAVARIRKERDHTSLTCDCDRCEPMDYAARVVAALGEEGR